jgi:hypothetical protein
MVSSNSDLELEPKLAEPGRVGSGRGRTRAKVILTMWVTKDSPHAVRVEILQNTTKRKDSNTCLT